MSPSSPATSSETRGADVGYELAAELIGRGQPFTFVACGGSMRPFVRSGDRVTVTRGHARIGDVVLVVSQGKWLLHRVLLRRRGRVLLKGDGLHQADGWFDEAAVLGRLVRIERGGRSVRVHRLSPFPVTLLRLFVTRSRP